MRKEPPISTSSPRETTDSLSFASAERARITAAALLLTTSAASAPVRRQSSHSTWLLRWPRAPSSSEYSRVLYEPAISRTSFTASSASSDRPRLVWMTTPVALTTRRRLGVDFLSSSRLASFSIDSKSKAVSGSLSILARWAASNSVSSSFTVSRPSFFSYPSIHGRASSLSMEGMFLIIF